MQVYKTLTNSERHKCKILIVSCTKEMVNKESLKSFQVIILSLLLHMQSQVQPRHVIYLFTEVL